ncbi:MAG: DUF523 and DUF1722 domain-containing protein [Desulfatibacillaceae bacterium]|nr:DUF523 and DUF1722 domain-containing protein [Desulfatibacillaceae bacterium]
MDEKIPMGISRCLLGESVRYDGGHKHDPYLTKTLSRYFEFFPVCPEVECGLPVPREAMRLVGEIDNPRLVTIKTGIDHTDRMKKWAKTRLDDLDRQNLCGFIFKSKSPSSGMERVKVYGPSGQPVNSGVGIFARLFMERFPLLPAEEEGRLHDPVLRENFIARVFVLKSFRETIQQGLTTGNLVDFHTRHKMLILSHSEIVYRQMGRLVANAGAYEPQELYKNYLELLTKALSLKPTAKKHSNVLLHMAGHFKKHMNADEKQELIGLIDDYRKGILPLIVPITLINHFVRRFGISYLAGQIYLNPHPAELGLRNHV